ncbi:DUF2147 domain-containing protein [Gemmatimonas sp.]|uniref:DUF2147 domain-containing protein n=2 Tax=Gemmatimonas sp. TaxID=1962908 RepID=UPI0022CBF13B|nr:DUF2147 domain-containing protein [Gemmatimonas sp.]MCZ8013947.1 DUF2147 domain-containing protein [Gemmatimonas sp.]MCZ8266518.1 DUF2147 domain-containing protein [Gemmatimonas sp.]
MRRTVPRLLPRLLPLLLAAAPAAPAAMATPLAAQTPPTPVGTWHTVDETTGKPRGIVEIVERNGVLTGIIRGTLVPGEPEGLCDKCPGDRRNQPITGLEMIRNVRRDGNTWGGGELLDPDNGKTYRIKLTPSPDGRTLEVRGFIGISLFGRSQTWRRAP